MMSSKRRLQRKRRKTTCNESPRKAKNTLRIATWNVRTMTTGLVDDLQKVGNSRKTAIINNELLRLNIDIAALQETRLPDMGKLTEKDYTFFWKGKPEEENREYGVGFAIRNSLLNSVQPPEQGTEHLIKMTVNTSSGPVHLICAYAPTLPSPSETKDDFYNKLDLLTKEIPANDQIVLLGDFNARVGADHEAWTDCLGKHGIGKMNENGQRLLEFSVFHGLCITNTYFDLKQHLKTSWRHPRSKLWHQLDLILVKKSKLNTVRVTRAFHSADCDSDHSLVCSLVKIVPKKHHRSKPPGKPCIDGNRTREESKACEFRKELAATLENMPTDIDSCKHWTVVKNNLHDLGLKFFGRKKHKNEDWFIASSEKLKPLIEKKRSELIKHKKDPTPASKMSLKTACNVSRKAARECANQYWQELAQKIQTASDMGNTRGVYEGIKKAVGPKPSKTAPLKSADGAIIKDKSQQMSRWVEHYSELYHRETKVTDEALDAISPLPCMLELDAEPNLDEMISAIDRLPLGKAPGMDGIPAEVVKSAGEPLAENLHQLLLKCWHAGEVPQDMRDAKIVTLYKNKGDKSDCNNYRGISLLSIVGKAFARIILNRLQLLGDRVYPESQCGFRRNRSTVDMIFSLRQLQEKCREQQKPLYIAFIDLTKAFDLVSREGLFCILEKIGCPPQLLSIIKSFHTDMKSTVQFEGDHSEPFAIKSGVKQGCVLAPTLFGIFFAVMLKHAFGSNTDGIYLHTRLDGGLYNVSRLKAMTKVTKKLIRDLLFADDAAIVTHTPEDLQQLMSLFSKACDIFGLTISIKKTNILVQGDSAIPQITVNGQVLEIVDEFTYLGSTITSDLSLSKEINKRIAKAATTLSKLTKRVWENSSLTIHTKMAVYRACVLSTLLYGSESWATYSTQEDRLNAFHMRSLRRILGIKWDDYITNQTVLEMTNMHSMYYLLTERRLRWLGHTCRMPDGRIPKDILFGELAQGNRKRGRPHLRYKDVCKRDMKAGNMDTNGFEEKTQNRTLWREQVRICCTAAEAERTRLYELRRTKRKEKRSTNQTVPLTQFKCPYCKLVYNKQTRLYSHLHTHHRHGVDWESTKQIVPLTQFKCPYCELVYNKQTRLNSHLHTHHRHGVDWS